MLELDSVTKALFRQDNVLKNIVLTFSDFEPVLTIKNDKIVTESLSLEENISDADNLEFGTCTASIFKISVADVEEDINGKEFTATMQLGTSSVQLGVFTVNSCERQANRRFKDIIAYDSMMNFDIDVSSWWNSLTFDSNLTVKTFREALCTQCGVSCVEQTLENDSVIVTKSISSDSMTARDMLKACMEINGAFGHIDRTGTFKAITLSNLSQETYAVNDYRLDAIPKQNDYVTDFIDKVQIKSEDEDIGGIYGTGTNALILEANFICFGKTAEQLNTIAANLYNVVSTVQYKPVDGNFIGLPYLEVGDCVTYNGSTTYVLTRNLSGIQSLTDSITANGSKTRSCISDVNSTFERVKALTHVLKNTVEELSSIITNDETGLQTIIQQLQDSIDFEVVKNDDIIAKINLSTEGVLVQSDKINLSGYVTITSLATEGQTEIDGGNITAGAIYSVDWWSRNEDGTYVLDGEGNKVHSGVGFKIDLENHLIRIKGEYEYTNMGDTSSTTNTAVMTIQSGRMTITNGQTGALIEQIYVGWEGIFTGNNPNLAKCGVEFHSGVFRSLNDSNSYNGTTVFSTGSPCAVMSKGNACIDAPNWEDTENNPNKCVFSKHFSNGNGCIDVGTRQPNSEGTLFSYYAGFTVTPQGEIYFSLGGNGSKTNLANIYAANLPLPTTAVKITRNVGGQATNVRITDTSGSYVNCACEYSTDGLITKFGDITVSYD